MIAQEIMHINSLYLLMVIYTTFHKLSYSVINIVFLLYTLQSTKSKWHYLATNNTIGLTLTWYWAIFLDSSLPSGMISKYNWSITKFVLGDIMLHFLPLLYSIYHMTTYTITNQDPIIIHSGIYTLFTNLLWSHVAFDSFDVSSIYVGQPKRIWNLIWFGNALFHLIPMLIKINIYNPF